MVLLQVNKLSFTYPRQAPIFSQLSFTIQAGEIITLLGPNGAGKSTLVKCLLGVNKLSSGEIILNDQSLTKLTRRQIARSVAYVPQQYQTNSNLTVFDYILTGRTPYLNLFQSPRGKDRELVQKKLAEFNLENIETKSVNSLSGGQLQLVTIIKALVQEPQLLILDEPMAALDLKRQAEVITLIQTLASNGVAVLLTTHQPDHAFMLKQKVGLLSPYNSFKFGLSQDILTRSNLEEIYQTKINISYLPELKRYTCQLIL